MAFEETSIPFKRQFYYADIMDGGQFELNMYSSNHEHRYLKGIKVFETNKLMSVKDIVYIELFIDKDDKPIHRWYSDLPEPEKIYELADYFPLPNGACKLHGVVKFRGGQFTKYKAGFEIFSEYNIPVKDKISHILITSAVKLGELDFNRHSLQKINIQAGNQVYTELIFNINLDPVDALRTSGYFSIKSSEFNLEGPFEILHKIGKNFIYYNGTKYKENYRQFIIDNFELMCKFDGVVTDKIVFNGVVTGKIVLYGINPSVKIIKYDQT